VAEGEVERLLRVAHEECYVASSLRTEVVLEPTVLRT
jgi:organic hydroperoxide reductase OsmC/OhrA